MSGEGWAIIAARDRMEKLNVEEASYKLRKFIPCMNA